MLVIVFMLTGIWRPQAAYCETISFAGNPVKDILDSITADARELIGELEGAISNSSFVIRQHVEILVQQLRDSLAGLMDKAFDELDAQHQKAIVTTATALDRLDQSRERALGDLRSSLNVLSVALGTIPFADRSPRITEIGPGYVLSQPSAPVTVKISGAWLSNGPANLTFDTHQCAPGTQVDTVLSFQCPASVFVAAMHVTHVSGVLRTAEPSESLDRPKKFKTSRIGIFVVPPTLGTARLQLFTNVDSRDTQSRTQSFGAANPHCQRGGRKTWAFNVTSGPENWRIDPGSIDVRVTVKSSASQVIGIQNVSDGGFQYAANVLNSGSCVRVAGHVVSRDGRGTVRGVATWTEYRTVTSPSTQTRDLGPVMWDKSIAVTDLPPARGLFVTIDKIDGVREVVSGSGSRGWFDVSWNPSARSLLIHPRPLHEALR
jgi:hypothetical protein